MNSYAVDKYAGKYWEHPDSRVGFSEDEHIPDYEAMVSLALRIAERLPLIRLASLDLCLDRDSGWRILEINLFSQTIRFAQYAGVPFFGEYTEEVVEYCEKFPYVY